MQQAFDFELADVAGWKAALVARFGDPLPVHRRPPLGALVKSMISSLTFDAASSAAYDALASAFPALAA